jgi:hypothetical protein
MNEVLRPLRLGEILDRTAQMYRARFLAFLGIATIPAATMFVFTAGLVSVVTWVGANIKSGAGNGGVLGWSVLIALIILVVPVVLGATALGEAAIADAAARFFLGHPITIRDAYKGAWKRAWRYVGLLVLQGLSIAVIPAIFFFLVMGALIATKVRGMATNDPSPVFGLVVFVLVLVVGAFVVWMLLHVCLAFPACVVEQSTAWTALRRGIRLSVGTKGRMLLLYILGLLLSQILAWAVAFPAMIAIALIPALQGQKHAQSLGVVMMVVSYGAMFAMRALTKPIYGIALTLLYFDQRIRKEGFDIEWMMQQAGMAVPERTVESPSPAVLDATTRPQGESTIPPEQTTIPANLTGVGETGIASAPREGSA